MSRIIDLTLTLKPGMRGVAMSPKYSLETDGWNATTLELYSHCGTHMDSQIHFGAGEQTIDQHPPQQCMGPAWVVDLGDVEPKALITVKDLGPVADSFASGDSLLLRSGWAKHVENSDLYRDRMPRIADDLAKWCVHKCVKLLGVEPPSVADVTNLEEVTRIHQTLLCGGVTIVEALTNLDQIRQPKVFFVALPLKIAGGDGCPVRALAIEGIPEDGWLGDALARPSIPIVHLNKES
jgi:arylformamidase